jgi:hypothetical protein
VELVHHGTMELANGQGTAPMLRLRIDGTILPHAAFMVDDEGYASSCELLPFFPAHRNPRPLAEALVDAIDITLIKI